MKKMIGVMGPGTTATKEQLDIAYQIGMLVGQKGFVLLSGGMNGTMTEACRGAQESGGLVVGICPTDDARDLCPYVDVAIVTGMRGARNIINILSSYLVIAIGATSSGTLSEIAFALQKKRPLLVVGGTSEMRAYLHQIESTGLFVQFAKTINEVERFLDTN
jgi:uncharacterized protein (TIGR00725 family)